MPNSFLLERKSNDHAASSGNEAQGTEASTSVLSGRLLKHTRLCQATASPLHAQQKIDPVPMALVQTTPAKWKERLLLLLLWSCLHAQMGEARGSSQASGFFLAFVFFQTNKTQALSRP